ncbi:hypothetical protein GN156_36030, partial [bacterium LRH843]|nr:hypothetical protein [bacterium LRH843]
MALSIATTSPLNTTCPPPLSLAASHIPVSLAAFASAVAWSKSTPIMAAMLPFPIGTA